MTYAPADCSLHWPCRLNLVADNSEKSEMDRSARPVRQARTVASAAIKQTAVDERKRSVSSAHPKVGPPGSLADAIHGS